MSELLEFGREHFVAWWLLSVGVGGVIGFSVERAPRQWRRCR